MKWYPHAKKPNVAVDLDAVLAEYESFEHVFKLGRPIAGARAFLDALSTFARIVIHTTRLSPRYNPGHSHAALIDSITQWLEEWEMPYDELWVNEGKPIAVAYIDDRAVPCRPQEEADAYAIALGRALELVGEKKRSISAEAEKTKETKAAEKQA